MPPTTRDKLITVAHDLFYQEGFTTVGLDRIIDEVGVTKTTFYNHFQSKDDLILAVLEHHDRWWRDTFRTKLREFGGDKPRDQIASIASVLEWMFSEGDFNGCIFVNVAVHFPAQHDPAHQAAARHKQAMEDILREIAGYAGAADPLALAQEVSFVLEGAYVTRQVMGNMNTALIAERMIGDIVSRYIPAS